MEFYRLKIMYLHLILLLLAVVVAEAMEAVVAVLEDLEQAQSLFLLLERHIQLLLVLVGLVVI
jgi:hypothetical protein